MYRRSKPPLNFIIASVIGYAITAFLIHLVHNAVLSGVCLVDQSDDIGEVWIPLVAKKNSTEVLMQTYFNSNFGADSMRIFMLTRDFETRVEFASVVNPESDQIVGEINFAPVTGDTYLSQKDTHSRGSCVNILVNREKPGLYRSSAERAGVAEIITCPLFNKSNYLIGYSALAYETAIEEAEIENVMGGLKRETDAISQFLS